jgi:hypothetical protein
MEKNIILASYGLFIAACGYAGYLGWDEQQCRQLIVQYDNGRRMPATDDPERGRFVRCYEQICGIRLAE